MSVNGDKISLEIKNTEKILITYYFKNEIEKDYFSVFNLGDEIKATGNYEIPNKNTIFHLFNYQEYLLSKNIRYLFKIDVITDFVKINENTNLFYTLKINLIKYLNMFKSKDYLNTLIIGDNNIDSIYKDSYRKNGISHLFAISGLHITLLTFLLKKLFEQFTKNKIFIHITLYLFLSLFMALVGFSPSVVRGSLLFILSSLNKLLKINVKSIYVLIFILSVILLLNPFSIYNIGFQFSFLISFYLIMCNKIIKRMNNYFSKLFIISIISFLASIPISIHAFFEINLLSPLINLIFVPFVSIIIFPLSLITLIIQKLDVVLFSLIGLMENVSYIIANNIYFNIILKDINWFWFIVYYVLISYVLYSWCLKKYYRIFYLIILLFLHTNINYFDYYLEVTMLDVGQGDSTLIKLPHNKGNILIDTGGNPYSSSSMALSRTIPYLKASGIKKIDYLILSHGDYDHIGESINLINNFKIDKVIFNNDEFNELETKLITELEKKKINYYQNIKTLKIADNKMYFLNNKIYDNENDNTSVIFFNYEGYKLLFMGDAGLQVEEDIVKKYNLDNIDILKVGHHGSKTSTSKYFVEKINPIYSVISVGKNNRYGHPNIDVLNNLSSSTIYRTDINGSINFKLRKNKLSIKTCEP